jgi:hypothetical protein
MAHTQVLGNSEVTLTQQALFRACNSGDALVMNHDIPCLAIIVRKVSLHVPTAQLVAYFYVGSEVRRTVMLPGRAKQLAKLTGAIFASLWAAEWHGARHVS